MVQPAPRLLLRGVLQPLPSCPQATPEQEGGEGDILLSGSLSPFFFLFLWFFLLLLQT